MRKRWPRSKHPVYVIQNHVYIRFTFDVGELSSHHTGCHYILHSVLSYQFPTLQILGEDLVTILDTLHVRYVIGLGEGAGANVIARFGLAHPTRTVGLILINCTGSAVSVKENFKAKVSRSKPHSSYSSTHSQHLCQFPTENTSTTSGCDPIFSFRYL